MTTLEDKIKEFRDKFEVRNYEADAHTLDIHILDLPDEIEQFLRNAISKARKEVLDEVERLIAFRKAEDTWEDIEKTIKELKNEE